MRGGAKNFPATNGRFPIGGCVLVLGFAVILATLLLLAVQTGSDSEGWVGSASSLKQLGFALQSYHDVHRKLPPAVGSRPISMG